MRSNKLSKFMAAVLSASMVLSNIGSSVYASEIEEVPVTDEEEAISETQDIEPMEEESAETEEVTEGTEETSEDIQDNTEQPTEEENYSTEGASDEEITETVESETTEVAEENSQPEEEVVTEETVEEPEASEEVKAEDVQEEVTEESSEAAEEVAEKTEEVVEEVIEEEKEEVFEDKELTLEVSGVTVKASGTLPENAELVVETIGDTSVYEGLISDYTPCGAFDITIMDGDEKYQPVEHDSTVEITLSGVEHPEGVVKVFRFEDGEATGLDTNTDGTDVTFITEHFTEFVVGVEVEEYVISYAVAEGQDDFGKVTVSDEKVTNADDITGSVAEALEGYEFVNWTDVEGNEVSTEAEFKPELKSASYTANFAEKVPEISERELTVETDGHRVVAKGILPENAELSVKKISKVESIEKKIDDEMGENVSFVVYDAFDIEILVDGEVWQPVEHDSTVEITITGVEIPADAENVSVKRVEDDDAGVTELSSEVDGDSVTFETEHFTEFVIGSTTLDSNDATNSWDISAVQDGSIMAYWYEDEAKLIITGSGAMANVKMEDLIDNLSNIEFTVEWVNADNISTITKFFNGLRKMHMYQLPSGIQSIADYAFQDCKLLELTSLPEGITEIGPYTFADCSNLALNELPAGITTIGHHAFYRCTNLTLTSLPSELTSVGNYAFQNCSSCTFDITNNISEIGEWAFYDCMGITSINMSDEITTLESYAFSGCKNVTTITLSKNLKTIGSSALAHNKCSSIVLPDGLETINDWALSDTYIESIDIPDSVTAIKQSAFYGNKFLKTINVGAGITELTYRVFYNCYNIESIDIPDSVTTIDEKAFYGCIRLTTISNGNSIEAIGEKAFYYDKSGYKKTTLNTTSSVLLNYDWTSDKRSIPTTISVNGLIYDITDITPYDISAAQDGSILAYYIADGVNDNTGNKVIITGSGAIKDYTFSSYDASPFGTITDTYTVIWDNTSTITHIGNHLFSRYLEESDHSGYYSTISYVTMDSLPNGVVTIGENAFKGCSSLALTSLPATVTSIGENAFENCNALALTSLPAGLTSVGRYAFNNDTDITVSELPTFLTDIGEYSFRNTGITISTIPSGITVLNDSVFASCSGITSMNFPAGLTTIGSTTYGRGAFLGCDNLKSISGGEDITTIQTGSFIAYTTDPLKTTIDSSNTVLTGYDWEGDNRTLGITGTYTVGMPAVMALTYNENGYCAEMPITVNTSALDDGDKVSVVADANVLLDGTNGSTMNVVTAQDKTVWSSESTGNGKVTLTGTASEEIDGESFSGTLQLTISSVKDFS